MKNKGFIFDIKKFAIHDGPGIRTTVFFKGCPLSCQWCHNPESIRVKPEKLPMNGIRRCAELAKNNNPDLIGNEVSLDDLFNELKKDTVFYEESGGGVTFSGGEPLMQPLFLKQLLQLCQKNGITSMVDTSGYVPWRNFEIVLDLVDTFLFDLKLMDNELHKKYTGAGNDLIHKNLKKLIDHKADIHIRIPLIPGITDTSRNLIQLKQFLENLPAIKTISFLPYNTISESKYTRFEKKRSLGNLQKQSQEKLDMIKNRFETLDAEIRIGG